MEMSVEKLR